MSEQTSVTRAAWSISLVTAVSRILGFIRVMVIAKIFGAGMVADAFFQAFRISNILREVLAEGSMSAAFIPVFTEYFHTKSKEEARELASSIFYILLFICIGVVTLGMAFSPAIVNAIAHGYAQYPEKFALTVKLTRIMFPYILFIGLSAVTMGMLSSLGSFTVPALSPVMLNLSMIGFALYVSPHMDTPVVGLALGVVFGGLLQLLIQLPPLKKKGMGFLFMIRPRDPGVKKVGRLTIPVIGSQASTQINMFISSLIATYLPEGSVSYLFYATTLFQFPHGIFGVSITTAVLPSMSRQAAVGDYDGLKDTLSFGLRYILFIMVPSMVGLIVLSVPITSLLFQRGTFTYASTVNTAYALQFYSLGLWAYSWVRIINACLLFAARYQDTGNGGVPRCNSQRDVKPSLDGPAETRRPRARHRDRFNGKHVAAPISFQEKDGTDRGEKDFYIGYKNSPGRLRDGRRMLLYGPGRFMGAKRPYRQEERDSRRGNHRRPCRLFPHTIFSQKRRVVIHNQHAKAKGAS